MSISNGIQLLEKQLKYKINAGLYDNREKNSATNIRRLAGNSANQAEFDPNGADIFNSKFNLDQSQIFGEDFSDAVFDKARQDIPVDSGPSGADIYNEMFGGMVNDAIEGKLIGDISHPAAKPEQSYLTEIWDGTKQGATDFGSDLKNSALTMSGLAQRYMYDVGRPEQVWDDAKTLYGSVSDGVSNFGNKVAFGIAHPVQAFENDVNRVQNWWNSPLEDKASEITYGALSIAGALVSDGAGSIGKIGSVESFVAEGAERLDRVPLSRKTITKGFQNHHIISNKNPLTKQHELLDLAGLDLDSRANKIFLPSDEALHPTRSIHVGRHLGSISKNLANQMDQIVETGRALGWSQSQYAQKLSPLLSEQRQALKAGDIALNSRTRPWATQ